MYRILSSKYIKEIYTRNVCYLTAIMIFFNEVLMDFYGHFEALVVVLWTKPKHIYNTGEILLYIIIFMAIGFISGMFYFTVLGLFCASHCPSTVANEHTILSLNACKYAITYLGREAMPLR